MASLTFALDVMRDPKYSRWMSLALLAGEAVLCTLIINVVPYTEIDWTTYMQQVELFLKGVREYDQLTGDTGPLVYPAVHVYIYSILYYLTDSGTSIQKAQIIFMGLYMLTLSIVFSCYRKVNAPPYLLIPLVLSKRIHSIFMLRLFNDAWAVLGFWLAVWFLQRKKWALASLAWSAGVGTKMTVLVAAPAVGAAIIQGAGLQDGIMIALVAVQVQIVTALPFMVQGSTTAYFSRAFEFSRQFLYEWTVNWKMFDEEIFLSRPFSFFLMFYHVAAITLFLNDRWVKPSSNNLLHFLRQHTGAFSEAKEKEISNRVTPTFVMDSMLGSMLIGMLFARSMHYQFFVYIAWATPYVLWRAGLRPGMLFLVWILQETGWQIFPSTAKSSLLVVSCLAVQVLGLWFGTAPEDTAEEAAKGANAAESSDKPHVE